VAFPFRVESGQALQSDDTRRLLEDMPGRLIPVAEVQARAANL